MDGESAKRDRDVAKVAKRQHGVVSVGQLRALGIGEDAVRGRVRAGRLHRLHRGVYAVGHLALSREATWMAAVLACAGRRGEEEDTGPVLAAWGAAISHRSAAVSWGLLPSRQGPVDISVPTSGGRAKRGGIRLHRSKTLLPEAVTLHDGIPVTTPARTISDLRRVAGGSGRQALVSRWELRRAMRQADVLGLHIGEETSCDRTRSDLERDFLRLCRRCGLPVPEVNVRIGAHLVDFLWPEAMLVVETDGYRYHRGRTAFEDDRARDLDLRGSGYDVVRIADRQITTEPVQIASVLRARLASYPSYGRVTRQAAP
jgi:very-short-patch-repair endonuclease